jgi:predicted RNA binding protein YcfA (HicA-like mRNA interferase family)
VGIDYALMRNLATRDMISALIRDGFSLDRSDGPHRIYYHSMAAE